MKNNFNSINELKKSIKVFIKEQNLINFNCKYKIKTFKCTSSFDCVIKFEFHLVSSTELQELWLRFNKTIWLFDEKEITFILIKE